MFFQGVQKSGHLQTNNNIIGKCQRLPIESCRNRLKGLHTRKYSDGARDIQVQMLYILLLIYCFADTIGCMQLIIDCDCDYDYDYDCRRRIRN